LNKFPIDSFSKANKCLIVLFATANKLKMQRVLAAMLLLAGITGVQASGLKEHFKGRYGAIELFDTGKKLSFRVNAPELSQARDFCEFHHLSIAIAAVETGVLSSFEADVSALDSAYKPGDAVITLKRALRATNARVFAVLKARLNGASLTALHTRKALPTQGAPVSAFALLDWFKALDANTLALKPGTVTGIKSALAVRKPNDAKLLSFSSRCQLERGALGASIGVLQRPKLAPVYFAISVDGKNRKDLFYVAPGIRDGALTEMGYFNLPVRQ
jgi:hypothetical protein